MRSLIAVHSSGQSHQLAQVTGPHSSHTGEHCEFRASPSTHVAVSSFNLHLRSSMVAAVSEQYPLPRVLGNIELPRDFLIQLLGPPLKRLDMPSN